MLGGYLSVAKGICRPPAYDARRRSLFAAAPAFPTLGELPLYVFAAIAATPGFFDRLQRCQGFLEDRFRLSQLLIANDPKLGPAIDGWKLARRAREVEVSGYTANFKCGENIFQMADHQRIFGAVNFFHCFTAATSRAARLFRLTSTSRRAKASVRNDRRSPPRWTDARERTSLHDGA